MESLIDRIAFDLGLDANYLSGVVARSSFYYKHYAIPKLDGTPRLISQASPELKTLQYWVVHNILSLLPISAATAAYKRGDSIKKHALRHIEARHILHTDIVGFFPNIHFSHLKVILEQNKNILLSKNLFFPDTYSVVEKICFRYDHLCIGTVSSPIISNIVLFHFDENLLNLCTDAGITYSRYADDIYISSRNYINANWLRLIQTELLKIGFQINSDKTSYHSKKNRCEITGLIITDDGKISVGLSMKNQIKKMIYQKLQHNIGDSEVILGYMAFLKDVEPATYNNFIIKYSSYCKGDIINALKS